MGTFIHKPSTWCFMKVLPFWKYSLYFFDLHPPTLERVWRSCLGLRATFRPPDRPHLWPTSLCSTASHAVSQGHCIGTPAPPSCLFTSKPPPWLCLGTTFVGKPFRLFHNPPWLSAPVASPAQPFPCLFLPARSSVVWGQEPSPRTFVR